MRRKRKPGAGHRPDPESGRSTGAGEAFALSDRSVFIIIVCLAVVLRVAYALASRRSPFFDHLDLDSKFYDTWAKQIAAGDWIGSEVFFMGPLYPYFLAVIYKIAGTSLLAVKIVQGLVGGLTAGGIFLLGKAAFSRAAGLIAGLIAVFYVPFIFYDSAILLPVLATCLNTFMLYFLVTGITRNRPRAFLAAGLLAGISAAGNASVLAFAGVAALFVLAAGGGRMARRVRMCAVFAAGVAAIVVPITLRNAVVGGDFVPVTSNAGLNLYIGNHEASTGAYVKPEGLDVFTDPEGDTIAEAASGRKLKPSEVSAWWAARAGQYIRENPGRFAANLVRKAFFFWSVYEVPQIEHLAFEKRYSALLRIPSPSFGIICPLGVMGIILSLRKKKSAQLLFLYVLTYSLTIISFFVVARYRLPMVPALMVFGGFTITWLVRAGVAGEYRKIIPVAIGIALLILAVNINFYGVDPRSGYAQSYYRLGIIHGLKGRPAEALDSYLKALEIDPDIVPARVGAGILLSQSGRYAEAKAELLTAVATDSTYEKAYYNLGLVYSEEGRPDSALVMMRKALDLDPGYMLARVGVATALYELGDLDEAAPLMAALATDPALARNARTQVEFLMGFLPLRRAWIAGRSADRERRSDLHLLRGDIMVSILLMDRALAEYEAAISIDPQSAAAYYQEGTIYFRRGDLDRTLASLDRALAADPGYEGANLAMGIVKVRNKDYEGACRAFRSELGVNPSSADAHMNLAMCYERHLIDIERAIYHLEKYAEITGGSADVTAHIEELRERARGDD